MSKVVCTSVGIQRSGRLYKWRCKSDWGLWNTGNIQDNLILFWFWKWNGEVMVFFFSLDTLLRSEESATEWTSVWTAPHHDSFIVRSGKAWLFPLLSPHLSGVFFDRDGVSQTRLYCSKFPLFIYLFFLNFVFIFIFDTLWRSVQFRKDGFLMWISSHVKSHVWSKFNDVNSLWRL